MIYRSFCPGFPSPSDPVNVFDVDIDVALAGIQAVPSERFIVRLFIISLVGGAAMGYAGMGMTGCLHAVGVFSTNCNWAGNPLGIVIALGGVILIFVGGFAFTHRRPPKREPEPFVPDEDGLYPIRKRMGRPHSPA